MSGTSFTRAERRAWQRDNRLPTRPPKRRKAPAASPILNLPGILLAYGQPDHSPDEVAKLMAAKRLAFERIRIGYPQEPAPGQPGQSDAHEMAELVNLLVLLSERVPDAQAKAHILDVGKAAQDAVLRAQTRMQSLSRFGLDGPGLQVIHEALDLYEQILPLIKPAHLAQALATMLQRQREGQVLKATTIANK